MNPNSVLSINAVEGFPLEDFSIEAVRSQLSEAQKVASGNGSAIEIAEANVEIEVSHAIQPTPGSSLKEERLLTIEKLGSGESAGCAQVIASYRSDRDCDGLRLV